MEIRNQVFRFIPYSETHRPQILQVWEESVLATHDFLSTDDFHSIKALVQTLPFAELQVFCLMQAEVMAGFIGVVDQKIEMLFLSPDYIGQGLGKRLIQYALEELKADKVDVNEQNTKAVAFYQKMGFTSYERSPTDDQGKPYPLLRMKL